MIKKYQPFLEKLIAELQRSKRASEAPAVRKMSDPSSGENVVMTSPYERPSSLSHPN